MAWTRWARRRSRMNSAPAIGALSRPVIRASVDGFHNPAAVRYRQGHLSPQGYFHDSFNHVALIELLLEPLGPGGSLTFRRAVFDFRADAAVSEPLECAEPNSILLLDGVFLLRPELRTYFDFSIFLRADFDVALARAEHRDAEFLGSIEEVKRRYEERYIPGQRIYLAEAQPERVASVVIDNNDLQRPVIRRPKYD